MDPDREAFRQGCFLRFPATGFSPFHHTILLKSVEHSSLSLFSVCVYNQIQKSASAERINPKEDSMMFCSRFVVPVAVACMFSLGMMQTGSVSAAEKSPCADDAAKYCKDVKPGKGAILNCLKENSEKLSPACKEKMGTPPAKKEPSACKDDAAKFCKGVKPGEGRIIKCMKEHENELSAPCKDEIKKAREAKTAK